MDILPRITGVLSGTLGFVGGIAIVVFLGIVVAAEPHTYVCGFANLFPSATQKYVIEIIEGIGRVLRTWLMARLASMFAVGVMVSIGLWALHVPMAGTLGLLAALLAFIPNLGPVLSAIPPILLAFTVSPRHALFVIVLFSAVHAMEGLLVTPLAERTMVRLPPGLTLSVQLLLGFVTGALGVALAAPLTIVAIELFRTVYREKVLAS
jgi:predicted PurR-regulated permease PerM